MPAAEVHILPTLEEASQAAAEFITTLAEHGARTQGRFTVALSGGTTPRALYQTLVAQPYNERVPWQSWHIFWGDERCVPPEHEDSNYLMAREALLDRVPIPPGQIHRIRGEVSPEQASQEYELVLREVFQTAMPSFDLILLGIGDDGHTASLFPGTPALQEDHKLVVANWAPHLQAHRITFTVPLINAARAVAFLVTDESKAGVLRQVLESPPSDQPLPAALVRPTSGVLHWFLTRSAATLLAKAKV